MELAGIAHAAMGHHRALAGMVAGLGAQVFRRVRLGAAGLASVVERGGPERRVPSGLEFHPALGQGVLDRLILPDRAAEHDAVLRILRGAGHRLAPDADGFAGNQDALWVLNLDKLQVSELFFV